MAIGRITRYGLPYSNVVDNGTATNLITPGQTLECLRLKLSNGSGGSFTKNHIKRIKFKVNGKVIIDASGNEIQKINAYRGANTTAPDYLDIAFTDYFLNNELDRAVGAFDTSQGVAHISTEVSIEGANSPILTPILMESALQKQSNGAPARFAGLMTKILPYPYSQSTGGLLPIQLPVAAMGAVIKRIHIFHTGNLKATTLKVNSVVAHECTRAENEHEQKSKGRVPQSGVYTLDFVVDGNVMRALDTTQARTLELLCDFAAADVGTVLVEYLDTLGNL